MNDILLGFMIGMILSWLPCYGAWCNGATDGYRFARNPYHPGARKAGRYLYKTMNIFYGDVPNPDEEPDDAQ